MTVEIPARPPTQGRKERSERKESEIKQQPDSLLRRLARRLTAPFILLLAAVPRFYQLSGQSLWADEGNSVALVQHSFGEIARRTAFDIHPPLYYWLLKGWTVLLGQSEIGLRSLSAMLGVLLVYLVGVLGTRLFSRRVGLLAAFIAALSPLQVYYSQEARMYMLLAVLATLTVLAALFILDRYRTQPNGGHFHLPGGLYVLFVTAGLYTHYAYPVILLAVNSIALIWLWSRKPAPYVLRFTFYAPLFNWLLLHLIPLLIYLPWLPAAWRQLTTWPAEPQIRPFSAILDEISTTLLFGLSWPFEWPGFSLVGFGAILGVSGWFAVSAGFKAKSSENTAAGRRPPAAEKIFMPGGVRHAHECSFGSLWPISRFPQPVSPLTCQSPWLPLTLLYLWLLLPIILTILIFSPAFLKFLLVAAPPLALLLAMMLDHLAKSLKISRRSLPAYLTGAALLALLTGASALALDRYYHDPAFARDNYRGIVQFIQAIGDAHDAVILNAEGQQDVFNYYWAQTSRPIPVYPLPHARPLNEAATLATLQTITRQADKIYAVYWATQQADPQGVIAGWLDSHLFKAADQWYGNVRLVSYGVPLEAVEIEPVRYRLGEHIRLTGYALSTTQIAPADILRVALQWETEAPLPQAYTVFVQLLDSASHVVGQRDAAPRTPAVSWPVGASITDTHGLFVEPGTPPGPHRLIVGLYDSETGRRLPLIAGPAATPDQPVDFVELAEIEVTSPARPLPWPAFTMQHRLSEPMGELVLLGYDLYKLGHRSSPDTPLYPGDPVEVVAYWMATRPVNRLDDQLFIQVLTGGGQATSLFFTRQPAGVDYPLSAWPVGQVVRAQYVFFLQDLSPGSYRLAFTLTGRPAAGRIVALSRPFRVAARE